MICLELDRDCARAENPDASDTSVEHVDSRVGAIHGANLLLRRGNGRGALLLQVQRLEHLVAVLRLN